MDAELKTKWVEALRSGDYTQGMKRLRSHDNTYCCLGVLCDVNDPTRWDHRPDGEWMYEGSWSGVTPWLPELTAADIQGRLQTLNDDDGRTFSEIADWIEENIPVSAQVE